MSKLNEEAKIYGEVFNSWEEAEVGIKKQFDTARQIGMRFQGKVIVSFHSFDINESINEDKRICYLCHNRSNLWRYSYSLNKWLCPNCWLDNR